MRTPLPVGTHLTLSAIGTRHQITVQIQELIGTGASCLVYTAVCRGGEQNEFYLPVERVLSGKSTPDSAAGRQFACGRCKALSKGIKSRCSSGSFRKAATASAMSRAFLPETAPGILL